MLGAKPSNSTKVIVEVLALGGREEQGPESWPDPLGLAEEAARCWLLTGHLQAVVQDRQQAGVGLRVLQLSVDQLKHLGSTLGVDVDLGVWGQQ